MGTIRDVAREAGVSASTVSRVVNGTAPISAETAARVRAAIKRANYVPSRAARTLRVQRSTTLGLLISDIQNPFFTALVRGVEDVAQCNGYSLILCNSDEDLKKELQYVQILCSEKVAGAIVVPASERSRSFLPFVEAGVPFIAVDRRLETNPIDCVLVDNVRGSFEAVAHLASRGNRRIAVVTGPLTTTTGRDRLEGYRTAIRNAGLPLDPDLERVGTFKSESGLRLTEELLNLRPAIDALFVANSAMELGALEALRNRSVRIPDDVAVIIYDEMPWSSLPGVSLTTVRQPTYELGRLSCLRLLDRMGAPAAVTRQEIVLVPELVVRDSTRAFRGAPFFGGL